MDTLCVPKRLTARFRSSPARSLRSSCRNIVDEDVERYDFLHSSLNVRRVGHVQCQGHYAFIRDLRCAAGSGVNSRRSPPEGLIDKCLPDATVGASDQNCFVFDVHIILLVVSICSYCCYYGCGRREDTSGLNILNVYASTNIHAVSLGPAAHTSEWSNDCPSKLS